MSRVRTIDRGRGPPDGGVEIHTVEQLGPNRSLLPNGNLLCKNVPITRSGWLIYGPGEVPVKVGPNGLAYVERTTDAMVDDKTIGSFIGAAVTNDHPPEDVTPANFKKYACGFVVNARQGTDDDADVILADLIISEKSTIDAILAGKVEVSAGYDADYMDLGNGVGKQFNLTGNHVALVRKGRCGPRCAIGDQEFSTSLTAKEKAMTQRVKLRGTTRVPLNSDIEVLRQKALDAQADLEAAEAGEANDDGVHVHLHMGEPKQKAATADASTLDEAVEQRFVKVEESISGIVTAVTGLTEAVAKLVVPSPTKDEDLTDKDGDSAEVKAEKATKRADLAKKTEDAATLAAANANEGDSKALETSYTQLMAQAEVLVPGFKVPTFDAAMTRAATVDRMCATRRKALDSFMAHDSAGAALLKGLNDGQEVETISMTCDAVATMFKSAAAAKAVLTNQQVNGASRVVAKTTDAAAAITPPGTKKSWAEINKEADAYWAARVLKA